MSLEKQTTLNHAVTQPATRHQAPTHMLSSLSTLTLTINRNYSAPPAMALSWPLGLLKNDTCAIWHNRLLLRRDKRKPNFAVLILTQLIECFCLRPLPDRGVDLSHFQNLTNIRQLRSIVRICPWIRLNYEYASPRCTRTGRRVELTRYNQRCGACFSNHPSWSRGRYHWTAGQKTGT